MTGNSFSYLVLTPSKPRQEIHFVYTVDIVDKERNRGQIYSPKISLFFLLPCERWLLLFLTSIFSLHALNFTVENTHKTNLIVVSTIQSVTDV